MQENKSITIRMETWCGRDFYQCAGWCLGVRKYNETIL